MNWLIKKIDSFFGWMFWIMVLFILAIGAFAMGFANVLIHKAKRIIK